MSGNNSVVECNLPKVEVASSNLVSRSKNSPCKSSDLRGFFVFEFVVTFCEIVKIANYVIYKFILCEQVKGGFVGLERSVQTQRILK